MFSYKSSPLCIILTVRLRFCANDYNVIRLYLHFFPEAGRCNKLRATNVMRVNFVYRLLENQNNAKDRINALSTELILANLANTIHSIKIFIKISGLHFQTDYNIKSYTMKLYLKVVCEIALVIMYALYILTACWFNPVIKL